LKQSLQGGPFTIYKNRHSRFRGNDGRKGLNDLSLILSAVLGYLSGSIPFGLLLTRAAGLGDVRKIGSGNIGATNVLRTGNKKIAALTLLCDVLKGLLPVLFGKWFAGTLGAELAGFAALAGHIFPVWLGFKGGKGVATALGVMLGWSWPIAVIGALTWMIMFWVRRISSLAALCAAIVAIPAAYIFNDVPWFIIALLALIIWVTHRTNIQRLLNGTEPKSSFTKTA
jgi:acyl phosphate:glycerol-3-phosphate acyltransferase